MPCAASYSKLPAGRRARRSASRASGAGGAPEATGPAVPAGPTGPTDPTDPADSDAYRRPHYQPNIPAVIEVPDAPLSELLETAARFYGERCAVDFLGAGLTYAELLEASERAAQLLRESGVEAGDRVSMIMPRNKERLLNGGERT